MKRIRKMWWGGLFIPLVVQATDPESYSFLCESSVLYSQRGDSGGTERCFSSGTQVVSKGWWQFCGRRPGLGLSLSLRLRGSLDSRPRCRKQSSVVGIEVGSRGPSRESSLRSPNWAQRGPLGRGELLKTQGSYRRNSGIPSVPCSQEEITSLTAVTLLKMTLGGS